MSTSAVEEFWESFYAEGKGRWSGNVNAALVEEVGGLVPGGRWSWGAGRARTRSGWRGAGGT